MTSTFAKRVQSNRTLAKTTGTAKSGRGTSSGPGLLIAERVVSLRPAQKIGVFRVFLQKPLLPRWEVPILVTKAVNEYANFHGYESRLPVIGVYCSAADGQIWKNWHQLS